MFEKPDPKQFAVDLEVTAYKQRISRAEDQGESVSQEQRLLRRAEKHQDRVALK